MKKYLLIIILIIFSGCSALNAFKPTLPEGTFAKFKSQYGEYYAGTVFIKGYSEIETVQEPFCETNNINGSPTETCKESEYVFFHIIEKGKTPNFDEYSSYQNNNKFFGEMNIGLGCIYDGNIIYSNDTDLYNITNGTLGTDLSKKIIGSNLNSTITLKLTKKPYTGGRAAPACYSDITIIEEF